ncbi:MAG: Hsp33 family molecular chaperone HslO [Lachnospiraceae bacterium]|nr:Hsp33 family molecular chaperone HslO [Lachnospiraceae bacterium]
MSAINGDHMIRAAAADGSIRCFAITSKDTAEAGRAYHETSPVVTAALGRMLSGGAMMGLMMKDERDLLTLQIRGEGPLKGITVTADNAGHVKGFPNVSDVEIPPKYPGKLDVGGAVGSGFLRVIRDTGGPEPYVGTVPLQTGEIAEDLTYYFAQSEQTPSAVGLGVLVDKDCTVSCSGGFIIQLMPDVKDETIDALEENLKTLRTVTDMLSDGLSPEDMLNEVLKGMGVTVLDKIPVSFTCDCSKVRVTKSLIALPKSDIQEMIDDNKPVEVRCQFCNKKYDFSVEELKKILEVSANKGK